MITRNFNLNLYAGNSSPLVINVNQYDNGEQWVFTLYDENGVQYIPSTGAIVGIKSDGLGIINTGSVVDGKVVINETQQMTAAIGKATFELTIDSQTHGTANFVVLVEPKPGDNASLSESDLSLIQEALNATSPLPTGGTIGQVLTKTANGSTWSDAGTPTQEQVAEAVSDWADENITVETGVVIDNSLSVSGAAADAKKTGDEISDLKSQIAQGGTLSHNIATALLDCFKQVVGKDGFDDAYSALSALLLTKNLVSISAVFNQGANIIYDDDDLSYLNQYLTVTATFDDNSTAVITSYELSGSLDQAESTITVTYEGKTTTFTVNVTLPMYDYLPSRDGVLSDFEGITKYVKTAGNWSETVTASGNLRVQGTSSSNSEYNQFVFSSLGGADGSHVHEGRIKVELDVYQVATTTPTTGIYSCSLKLSNGSNGLTFGQAKNGSNINLNYAESTAKTAKTIESGDVWHTYDLRYSDSVPIQKATIDGESLFSSNTLSSVSTTSSCLMGVGNPTFFIKSLKVYNKYRGD